MLVSGCGCEKCKLKLQHNIMFNILTVTRKVEYQGVASQPSWNRDGCTGTEQMEVGFSEAVAHLHLAPELATASM